MVPIGVLEEHEFSEHIYTFNKNTTLLFYTDGITDTENQSGQFYGQDKMIRCVEAQTLKTPAFIIQALLEDIHSHIGQGNQSDDLTLLGDQIQRDSGKQMIYWRLKSSLIACR